MTANPRTTLDDSESSARLLACLRKRSQRSRGQMARRLGISTTVLYNLETGRTRIELGLFLRLLKSMGVEPLPLIGRHLFSVAGLTDESPGAIVRAFRNRLQWSQARLGRHLGYATGAMVHHFEKGLREPSLVDLFLMMTAAGDNLRGLVLELTGDETLAARFPEGRAALHGAWHEYWERPHLAGMRQIMRSAAYRAMPRYEPGFFGRYLPIDAAEERAALKLLKSLDLIRWRDAKPEIRPETRIVIPQDIPRATLDRFKAAWLRFAARHYEEAPADRALCSIDLLPVNQRIFDELKARIRAMQDEVHNLRLKDTDGFVCLGWQANYVPL